MPVKFSPILLTKLVRINTQRLRHSWLAIAAALALLQTPGAGAADDCGTIQLASGTNASTELLANIDELILKGGFDCSIEGIATDNELTAILESAEPVLVSAIPVNHFGLAIKSTTDTNTLRTISDNPITGVGQSWWISPEAVKKHPELKTVLDVLEHPELFAVSDDTTEGVFFGCPADSDCHHITANLFRAFEMEEKNWMLVTPDSWADLEHSLTDAIKKGHNWFGSYGSPSAMMGRHTMIKLDFGIEFAGAKNWDGCIAKPVADCDDPKPSAWRPLQLQTVVTDSFDAAVPGEAIDYLSAREFPGALMSALLALQFDQQLNAAETASVFLLQHTEVWKPWVSADIAKKVINSLSTLR